jgi:hypothetical protein
MEYWRVEKDVFLLPITPVLQYPNTPKGIKINTARRPSQILAIDPQGNP